MNNFLIFADQVTSVDKKTLTVFLVVFVILFILFAAIGTLIRKIMQRQGQRAQNYMGNVYSAGVVKTTQEYRRFAQRKNFRVLFKQSLIPTAILLGGILIYIIASWVKGDWSFTPFKDSKDLFPIYDFKNQDYYTYVFKIKLLAEWPEKINEPHIEVEHIVSYLEALCFTVSIIWFFIACQGFIARFITSESKARSAFSVSIDDIKKAKDQAVANATVTPPPAPQD